jgi:hypothetical protein
MLMQILGTYRPVISPTLITDARRMDDISVREVR